MIEQLLGNQSSKRSGYHGKKTERLNVRVDEEAKRKLEIMKSQSNKSSSEILRELILKGRVEYIADGTKLIQELGKAEMNFQDTTLEIEKRQRQLQSRIDTLTGISDAQRYSLQCELQQQENLFEEGKTLYTKNTAL